MEPGLWRSDDHSAHDGSRRSHDFNPLVSGTELWEELNAAGDIKPTKAPRGLQGKARNKARGFRGRQSKAQTSCADEDLSDASKIQRIIHT